VLLLPSRVGHYDIVSLEDLVGHVVGDHPDPCTGKFLSPEMTKPLGCHVAGAHLYPLSSELRD
jgi:hypothetical protein